MTPTTTVSAALASFDETRCRPEHAMDSGACPPGPGLYAIYGDVEGCDALVDGALMPPSSRLMTRPSPLGPPPIAMWVPTPIKRFDPAAPLYIGKAHKLASRDVRTHFKTGKTGSSTVRRTLAALIDPHDTEYLPRSDHQPGSKRWSRATTNYKLSQEHEERLTGWMCRHLELGWWAWDATAEPFDKAALSSLERCVIETHNPPLNLTHSAHPFADAVRGARATAIDLARGGWNYLSEAESVEMRAEPQEKS